MRFTGFSEETLRQVIEGASGLDTKGAEFWIDRKRNRQTGYTEAGYTFQNGDVIDIRIINGDTWNTGKPSLRVEVYGEITDQYGKGDEDYEVSDKLKSLLK